ncbi:hypothetical protein WJX74_003471 [Apatococcus lobatus]|uniref:Uncharacterized protein n=1 Tax=Apatococcus lobatus TaxID=904363 RepID=A0AAW1Q5X8_9CHLO
MFLLKIIAELINHVTERVNMTWTFQGSQNSSFGLDPSGLRAVKKCSLSLGMLVKAQTLPVAALEASLAVSNMP